jgi:hypothetical protein
MLTAPCGSVIQLAGSPFRRNWRAAGCLSALDSNVSKTDRETDRQTQRQVAAIKYLDLSTIDML